MTKVMPERRSARLKNKNKPIPKYVLKKCLKQAIHVQRDVKKAMEQMKAHSKMMNSSVPITKKEVKAVMESNKKYDDIFSAVVEQAKTPKRPFSEEISSDEGESSDSSPVPGTQESQRSEILLISEDDDIMVLGEVFGCSCGQKFHLHTDCHQHLAMEHDDTESDLRCNTCGLRSNEIYTKHVCHICGSFAEDLNAHIVQHYRNCTSKSAVMECRFCTRQFLTVREVVQHEKEKHTQKTLKKTVQYHRCNDCSFVVTSPEALTVHYTNHINMILLFERIEELQYKVSAEKDECPFCRTYVGSRKTFRGHILKQHYPACKSLVSHPLAFDPTPANNDSEVKKEVDEIVEFAARQDAQVPAQEFQVKQEVKQEEEDDGYPAC